MSTGGIQNPEGAKAIILAYKKAAEATIGVARQNLKIVRFANTQTGRLLVDKKATTGGNKDGNMQGRRMVLI